jgi:RNA polymerase sigma-70 factor (ECF subfamily)
MIATGCGDDEAFRALARRHRRRLERFALRYADDHETARDLAQETLIRLWRAAGRYEPGGQFLAYLYTIASNVCRSRAPGLAAGDRGELPEVPAPEPSAYDERTDAVKRAVRGLPERYREVVVLSAYEGLSYDEIAAVVGCPRGTVASRKATAVRLLRDRLAGLLAEEESG